MAKRCIQAQESKRSGNPAPIARLFSYPYVTAEPARDHRSYFDQDLFYRRHLEDEWVVRPALLDVVLANLAEGHSAVEGPPGSGKSGMAAWVDWTFCKQGQRVEFISSRSIQDQKERYLADAAAGLPDGTLLIIDDVHLIREQLHSLLQSDVLRRCKGLFLGRTDSLAWVEQRLGAPPTWKTELSWNDGAVIADELAHRFLGDNAELRRAILKKSKKNLVLTRYLLAEALGEEDSPKEIFATYYKQGDETLLLFLILLAFRQVEFSCDADLLDEVFGVSPGVLEQMERNNREAEKDPSTGKVRLKRHPLLAQYLLEQAPDMEGVAMARYRLKNTFKIERSSAAKAELAALILGAVVAHKKLSIERMTDRLMYGRQSKLLSPLIDTAAELVLAMGKDAWTTHPLEWRLPFVFSAYDAYRRIDEQHAWRKMKDLRSRLGVSNLPPGTFEGKGYLLYQEGIHYDVNNRPTEAIRRLTESAQSERDLAKQMNDPAQIARLTAKACQSQNAALQIHFSKAFRLDGAALEAFRRETLPGLLAEAQALGENLEKQMNHLDDGLLKMAKRFRLNNAYLQGRINAVLGHAEETRRKAEFMLQLGDEIDPSWREDWNQSCADLIEAELADAQGQFREAIAILTELKPKDDTGFYLGREGRRRQLLARAHYGLGEHSAYERLLQGIHKDLNPLHRNQIIIDWAREKLGVTSPQEQSALSDGEPDMTAPQDPPRDKVVFCYDPDDKAWFEQAASCLKPLIQSGAVTIWSRDSIAVGTNTQAATQLALASAKVAVMLVTPKFLASDQIMNQYMPPLLSAAKAGMLRLVWVPVKSSLWVHSPLYPFNPAHDPEKPLDSLDPSTCGKVWTSICEDIYRLSAEAPGQTMMPASAPTLGQTMMPTSAQTPAYPQTPPVTPQDSEREICHIIFFAADPRMEEGGQARQALALDLEYEAVRKAISEAHYGNQFKLTVERATTPDDLLQLLNEHEPTIVHFSGHGTERAELVMVNDKGHFHTVSNAALEQLFKVMKGKIRCVFLNACYSEPQAKAIIRDIDCAIGMSKAVTDKAAREFSMSFYRALAYGRSIENAFQQGVTKLMLENLPEEYTPQLLYKPGVDPAKVFPLKKQV